MQTRDHNCGGQSGTSSSFHTTFTRAAMRAALTLARRRCPSSGQPRRFTSGVSLAMTDTFAHRHIGPREKDVEAMLKVLPGNYKTLDELADAAVPDAIKLSKVRVPYHHQ